MDNFPQPTVNQKEVLDRTKIDIMQILHKQDLSEYLRSIGIEARDRILLTSYVANCLISLQKNNQL